MTTESTEAKFKQYCKKHKYCFIKLQLDKSNLMLFGLNTMQNMPSDFIVCKHDSVEFVECKEILKLDRFYNSRFKQQYRLTKLANTLNQKLYKEYILLNFIKYKKTYLIPILEYNKLLNNKQYIDINTLDKHNSSFEIKL